MLCCVYVCVGSDSARAAGGVAVVTRAVPVSDKMLRLSYFNGFLRHYYLLVQ